MNIKKKYDLFEIYWNRSDVRAVSEVIKRGYGWAIGKEIKEFEKKISKYLGSKYVVSFNSGTSALYSVLLAYGITSGEVIVPSFTFISTVNCVILSGAQPVFADIEEDTMGLDYEDVKAKITSRTRAIIPVHYGGRVCRDIEKLKVLADKYKLILIEDNAEGFGAKINDKFAGTIGHAGMLSFCQNKVITTGEGGAICTDDKLIYEKLLLIRSHGRINDSDYFSRTTESGYIQTGYNFRMPSMCAALGSSQLNKIRSIIDLRREIAQFYDEKLRKVSQIKTIPELPNQRCVYQLYSILVEEGCRDKLQKYLLKRGIYTKVYFYPIHLKEFYNRKYNLIDNFLFKTEDVSDCILSLPFSLNFSEKDQMNIINKIKKFFKNGTK